MTILLIFLALVIPCACLCAAAVLALRGQHRKAAFCIVAAGFFLLLTVLYLQSLADVIHKAQQMAPDTRSGPGVETKE